MQNSDHLKRMKKIKLTFQLSCFVPKSSSFSFMQCLYKNESFLIRVIPDFLLLYFRRLDTVDVPCHNHGLIGFYLVYLASWTIPRYFFTYLQSFQTSLHFHNKYLNLKDDPVGFKLHLSNMSLF